MIIFDWYLYYIFGHNAILGSDKLKAFSKNSKFSEKPKFSEKFEKNLNLHLSH